MNRWFRSVFSAWTLWILFPMVAPAGTKTWDGKWDTSTIEVTVVYFVPADRKPLADWKDRVNYFCRRIEQFHGREFQGQSALRTIVHPEPLVSEWKTSVLRQGDANAIFFRTLQESDRRLKFGQGERKAFPILLVLSEINWQALDDFYRLKPVDDGYQFEGQNIGGQHFPGAAAGGARATYLDDRGVGWGLVSADGWRVPYRGSDCVVYHEGCGHTVGLPHPEPIDGSVMGVAQYQGWINESFLNKEQKIRLNWEPKTSESTSQQRLFDAFTAIPEPLVPQPGETVALKLTWPDKSTVKSLRVRYQTAIDGPWIDAPQSLTEAAPSTVTVGVFDRPTPLSYRVDATLSDGSSAELWGYLQVRSAEDTVPEPAVLPMDLLSRVEGDSTIGGGVDDQFPIDNEIDVLARIQLDDCWVQGDWKVENGILTSPKKPGSRLELPYSPEADYRMHVIVEAVDEPNGLILGQRLGTSRFVTLFNFNTGDDTLSAIENVDGKNVGNETTFSGELFRKRRLSQVVVTVRSKGVTMSVDGQVVSDWHGKPEQLSLSDYWATPNQSSLFIGAYDCQYRIHRLTVTPAK